MTLSQEPLPAPGLRSHPARRWAAGGTLLPRWVAGGGDQGRLAGAAQVLGQLLDRYGGCWWGAELAGQREHHHSPAAPLALPVAGDTGHGCARR